MAEELKIVLAVDGADKVAAALDNTSEALKDTADEAKRAGDSLKNNLRPNAAQAGATLTNLNRVVQDAPYGFIGIANNLTPLVESFQRLQAESKNSGGALKALVSSLSGPGGLALGFSVVTTAISFAQIGLQYWFRESKKAAEAADELKKSTDGIFSSVAKEGTQVISLVAVLNNETETRQRKLDAIKELNKIAPETFKNIKLEGDAVIGLDNAYKNWLENQKKVIAAKIIQGKLDKLIEEQLKNQGIAETGLAATLGTSDKAIQKRIQIQKDFIKSNNLEGNALIVANNQLKLYEGQLKKTTTQGNNLTVQIEALTEELIQVSEGIKVTTSNTEKGAKKAKKELESFDTVIRKTLEGLRDQEQIAIAIDQSTIDDQIKIVKDTINKAIKEYNLPSNDQRVIVLSAILDELEATKAAEDGAKNIKKNIESKPQFRIKQKIVPEIETKGIDVAKLEKDLTAILNQTMINVGISIGETLGNALTGAAKLGDVFKGIFSALANGVKAMGEKMIELGVLALALRVSLTQIFENPALAIAVGIGLVALGQALNNLTTSKFAVGTRFSPGGMALVGERGPEMISLPRGSQVVPAAQTSAMLGGRQQVEVVGVLRGQDIFFSNKKYGQTYNRQT